MLKRIIRWLIAAAGAAAGLSLSLNLFGHFPLAWPGQVRWAMVGLATVVAGLLALAVAPYLMEGVIQLTRWLENRLTRTPAQEIAGGAIGLIIGLIIANLLGVSFYRLPFVGPYLPLGASLILGYVGWNVGARKREELQNVLPFLRLGRDKAGRGEARTPKILDTSVIIDGRIADILRTGFIEGTLIVPGFVLEELRHIADSADLLKRNRGRRGLDVLNHIRKEMGIAVRVLEKDYEDLPEVDSKLVRLAQEVGGQILTNDFNLNKVAELQGVRVLNINELANAVKPVVLPGEEMQVQVIKDGKEAGQGVGYLDDGTMIVVENGRRFIGQKINVQVTSVLQTAAGRMIFARPRQQRQGAANGLERGEYQWMT